MASLEEAANKEGTLTWCIAQMSSEDGEITGGRFTARYPGHYPALRERGALANDVPLNVGELGPAFRSLGEDGYYYPTCASLQIMI